VGRVTSKTVSFQSRLFGLFDERTAYKTTITDGDDTVEGRGDTAQQAEAEARYKWTLVEADREAERESGQKERLRLEKLERERQELRDFEDRDQSAASGNRQTDHIQNIWGAISCVHQGRWHQKLFGGLVIAFYAAIFVPLGLFVAGFILVAIMDLLHKH
jgi:hypothetical protein